MPVYRNKVAQRTAALHDGGRQDVLDGFGQPVVTGPADARGRRLRVDPGAEQAFAGVDVADADHDVARQQHLLDRRIALARLAPQEFARKTLAQRLHAEPAQQQVFFELALVLGVPEHGAEAARIVQAQHLPALRAVHDQVEVVVLARLDPGRQHAQVAGHAEVDDQGAVFEFDQQVLAAASGSKDAASGQQLGQTGREGPAQAFAAQDRLLDDAAFDMGRDTAPGDFYFWQFRHGVREWCKFLGSH